MPNGTAINKKREQIDFCSFLLNWDLSVSYKEKDFRFFEKKLAKNFFKALRNSSRKVCANSTKPRANYGTRFWKHSCQLFLFANEQKL